MSIYLNLVMIRRRSSKDKTHLLITDLKINIGDLNTTIDDVIKIRNKLTHTGIASVLDFNYQWKTYNDFDIG
jgi:hypothetical protein